MNYSRLKNVTINDKGTPPRFEDYGKYENSSDVTSFNLYDQDWQTLKELGLTRFFNDDKNEFDRKKERLISNVS